MLKTRNPNNTNKVVLCNAFSSLLVSNEHVDLSNFLELEEILKYNEQELSKKIKNKKSNS